MKIKWWIVLAAVILAVVIIFGQKRGINNLVSPNFSKISQPDVSQPPTPSPASRPKQYNFDSSTDLKMELESINPQVLESDFE